MQDGDAENLAIVAQQLMSLRRESHHGQCCGADRVALEDGGAGMS